MGSPQEALGLPLAGWMPCSFPPTPQPIPPLPSSALCWSFTRSQIQKPLQTPLAAFLGSPTGPSQTHPRPQGLFFSMGQTTATPLVSFPFQSCLL